MKLFDLIKLKTIGYIIVDDFFPVGLCEKLRNITLNFPSDSSSVKTWSNYQAINFDLNQEDWSLKKISDKYVIPKVSFLNENDYSRGWSLRFNTTGTGVGPHTDPAQYTVNVWVTPNHSLANENSNGLIMYRKRFDNKRWMETYNWTLDESKEYVKHSRKVNIPYKFNRAVIFESNQFHETDNVIMKPGVNNCRVSYTFLYDK